MKLRDKVVLVTGGNSGIGRAIALRAAAEGAHVAITGRDPAKGARVLGELQAAGAPAAADRSSTSLPRRRYTAPGEPTALRRRPLRH